jgi:hypothetical protein
MIANPVLQMKLLYRISELLTTVDRLWTEHRRELLPT